MLSSVFELKSDGVFPLIGETLVSGEKPRTLFVSLSEAGPGPRPKPPQFSPGVGQGRIGAELGTFGVEYDTTRKPDTFKKGIGRIGLGCLAMQITCIREVN